MSCIPDQQSKNSPNLLRCVRQLLALFDACRDATICLKLRDKPTLRGHRRSGVVDPTETSTGHSDCRCRGDYRVLVWVRANALS